MAESRKKLLIVLLRLYHLSRWQAVVVGFLNSIKLQMVPKNFLLNCASIYVCRWVGILRDMACLSQKMDITWTAYGFEVSTVHVSLEYPSVVSATTWLPGVVFSNGPGLSMMINSSWPLASKNFRHWVGILLALLGMHLLQFFTVLYTLFVMCVHYTSPHMVPCNQHSIRSPDRRVVIGI